MIIGEKLDKMGKRSNFERIERDFYPTPEEALIPLLPHLPKQVTLQIHVQGMEP